MEKNDLIFYMLFIFGFGGILLLNFLARRNKQSLWMFFLYAPISGLRTDIVNMTRSELMKSGRQFLHGSLLLLIFSAYTVFLSFTLYDNQMPPVFVLIILGLALVFMVLFLASSLVLLSRGLLRSNNYIPPHYQYELVSIGHAYLRNGDFEQAKNQFASAIKLTPDYIDAYIAQGMVSVRLKDYDSAQQSYEKALQLIAEQEDDQLMEASLLEDKIFILLLQGRDDEADCLIENPLFENAEPEFWQHQEALVKYTLPRSYAT